MAIAESMHILMAHNYYQYSGGEDVSMMAEIEILRHAGHRVRLLKWHNNDIASMSRLNKISLFWRTVWNSASEQRVYESLRDFNADLLHGQNLFPLASPSIYRAACRLNVPVVQHLRNFRLTCLNAYLYRQGSVCEACVGRNPWRGVVRRCYRNSLPASMSLWQMLTFHRWRHTWERDVDAFIAPSQFAADKLIEVGVPADKLYVKPNFVADPLALKKGIPEYPKNPVFVVAGRLSDEKGVFSLLKAWCLVQKPDWQLMVLGDGPELSKLSQFCQEKELTNVDFLGQLSATQVLEKFQQASLVLVPSLWYETFGRVVVEAFACGRAAIVSDLGALAELVDDNVTGCRVSPGDERAWAERIRWCAEHLSELQQWGKAARHAYKQLFTPELNYRQLTEIYAEALRG